MEQTYFLFKFHIILDGEDSTETDVPTILHVSFVCLSFNQYLLLIYSFRLVTNN